jgi:hypothetical protein
VNSTTVDPRTCSHFEPLADLVARVDLNELVARDAGHGRQNGHRMTYRCPNHGHHAHGDRTPSFTVTTDAAGVARWRCWGACQTGGDALDYVQWWHHVDRPDAIRWLREYTGTTSAAFREFRYPQKSITPPRAPTVPTVRTPPEPTGTRVTDAAALELMERYAAWRGWPLAETVTHGLHVVEDDAGRRWIRHPFDVPHVAGPLMFGWQDRAEGKRLPKWKAPPSWPLPLWGTCSLVKPSLPAVVIAEGPADGITATYALRSYAPIAVVAVPGVSTWRADWSPLFTGLHVVTALDPDTAGHTLTKRIAHDLEAVAATVTAAASDLLTHDLCDTLKRWGPHYVAAALLEPFAALEVIDT